jgi:hypothetical protein
MDQQRQHDLTRKTDEEIANWIANHERLRRTDATLYRALVEERARRFGDLLKPDVPIARLTDAAKEGQFTTYGALAEANGVVWSKARHPMNGNGGHLDQLLDICHARGLPLLTAICVNKDGVETGRLSPEALAGFAKGARRLGHVVSEEETFLRECQEKCFAWGKGSA